MKASSDGERASGRRRGGSSAPGAGEMAAAAGRLRARFYRPGTRTLAVMADSHPALDLDQDGRIVNDTPDEPAMLYLNGCQLDGVSVARHLERIAAAVGRIDLEGVFYGTGTLVSPTCIVTARHVVAQVRAAAGRAVSGGPGSRDFGRLGATIDFRPHPDGSDSPLRARIVDYVGDTPEPIEEAGTEMLDLAALEIEPVADIAPLKPDFSLVLRDIGPTSCSAVAVIGFPQYAEIENGLRLSSQALAAIHRVFGAGDDNRYGRKRIGVRSLQFRPFHSNPLGVHVTHTAPTMPCCSGGPLINLSSMGYIGVHTAGKALSENVAQVFSATLEEHPNDPFIGAIHAFA